jgi:plasmid stability protein
MPRFARTQEIEHEIGPSGRFSLRITSADVELRAVDGPVARVRATYDLRADSEAEADDLFDRLGLRVQAHGHSLELDEPRQVATAGLAAIARLFGGASSDLHIAAEVPRGAEIRYNGVNAELTASGFRGAQHYRTVSGDAVLTEVGGTIRVQSVSGDVSLRGAEPIELEAGSVSGDVAVMAPRLDLFRANTVSGDVELEGQLAGSRDHRVETVSGDLTIGLVGDVALEVRGLSTDVDISLNHRSEGSRDRRRYVIGEGGPSLSFRSMSGDVSVHPARRVVAPAPTRQAPAVDADAQLEILRAVERGEIDVDEAARRLAGEER